MFTVIVVSTTGGYKFVRTPRISVPPGREVKCIQISCRRTWMYGLVRRLIGVNTRTVLVFNYYSLSNVSPNCLTRYYVLTYYSLDRDADNLINQMCVVVIYDV